MNEDRRNSDLYGKVLQTIGGILLLICSSLCYWNMTRIIDYGERLIRVETKQAASDTTLQEVRQDVKKILEIMPRKAP